MTVSEAWLAAANKVTERNAAAAKHEIRLLIPLFTRRLTLPAQTDSTQRLDAAVIKACNIFAKAL